VATDFCRVFELRSALEGRIRIKIFSSLLGLNQTWAGKPYLLILGTALLKSSTGDHNRFASYDLGQASWSFVVQDSALGLMCHSLGGFDHDTMQRDGLSTLLRMTLWVPLLL
jgi:hypothetical protein